MKINKNDPQLTAYVLNELPAQQMKAIESQIQNNPELKLEVARLKSNITQLKNTKAQDVYRLDPHQRENIFKAAGIYQNSIWTKILKYSGGLVAASLAVIVYVNNSGDLQKSASSKVSNIQAAPSLSETSARDQMAAAPAESLGSGSAAPKQMAAKKAITQEPIGRQNEGALLPTQNIVADSAAPSAPAKDMADSALAEMKAEPQARSLPIESQVAASKPQAAPESVSNKELSKGAFSAGEVGAADMAPSKMKLFDPAKAEKKEMAASGAVVAENAGLAANTNYGALARGGSPKPSAAAAPTSSGAGGGSATTNTVSKQLYDLESKSSQPEIYAKIADPIFKCFDSSLSQYVKYDVAWNLTWSAKLGNVTSFSSEIIDYGTESLKTPRQNFTAEISCAEQVIRQAFKTSLPPSQNENTFKYRLILKSK